MKKALFAAALAVSCGVASAQGYAGALIGMSKLNADCAGTTACDNSDTAFKFYGGYEVAPNISVELGYTDFGKFTATGGRYSNIEVNAFSVVGAYRGSLGTDWTGVARLGLASVKAKWDVTQPGSESKIGLYAGVGAEYDMTKEIKLTGAFDVTTAEINGDSGGVYIFGVGAQIGF